MLRAERRARARAIEVSPRAKARVRVIEVSPRAMEIEVNPRPAEQRRAE